MGEVKVWDVRGEECGVRVNLIYIPVQQYSVSPLTLTHRKESEQNLLFLL